LIKPFLGQQQHSSSDVTTEDRHDEHMALKHFVYHLHHNFRGNVLAILEYLGLLFLALSMFMLCEPMKKLHVGAIFVY
jgi:hypothetical protein